ncbi:hypothetical protein DITRI_Ditri03aG0114900 [Diplodiscus trichospermus]
MAAGLGDGRRWGNRVEFVPTSDWTQDAKANYLFLDLPGFKKEQLRLELASAGHIIVSGERIVNENKSIYFQQTFILPENSDMDKIRGQFDGDFLHVTVPRRCVVEENSQQQSRNENYAKSTGEKSVHEEANNHGKDQSKPEGHSNHEQHHGEMISRGTCRVTSIPKEMIKNWKQQNCPLGMAMDFLKKNKGVVLSVVIAFSIGVLVLSSFETSG